MKEHRDRSPASNGESFKNVQIRGRNGTERIDAGVSNRVTMFKVPKSRLGETFQFTRRGPGGWLGVRKKGSSERRDVGRTVLYFKVIQIPSDMKVRRVESAARWVVVGQGATHPKKKLTRLNCRANRISAFL